jgi:DNA-binding helix-hairpin-helix protein with protein kinase domain
MSSDGHADLGPELRKLAQAILDRIDPALRTAAVLAAARSGEDPGRCQQVWCPVCALAALVTGEEHPLLTVVSEHSVALLAMVRALVADSHQPAAAPVPDPPEGPPEGPGSDSVPPSAGAGHYQPIPVIVESDPED